MTPEETTARARKLRRASSLPEGLLWREVRRLGNPAGLRRQHPVGPYFADFCCPAARVLFEVDGMSHETHPERDLARDEHTERLGFRTCRIPASRVLQSPGGVALWIAEVCQGILTEREGEGGS